MKRLGFLLLVLFFLFSGVSKARGPVYLGVSDTGEVSGYLAYQETLQRRVPFLQTFHTWGTSLRRATLRWEELGVRPILHISLTDENSGLSLYSLRAISEGAGDDYLLQLNQDIRKWNKPILVRPLGEPNRPLNSYSAYLANGAARGDEYSPRYYRRAFRRISIIVQGGTPQEIEARLRQYSLTPLMVSGQVAKTKARIIFSPLPSSLGITGNEPGRFNPGKEFYQIVGTSFFSKWRDEKPLKRFYRKFSPGKWFYFLEWGLNSGKPGFVKQIYRFCWLRKRCRGMIYYQGFLDTTYRLENYPLSAQMAQNLSKDITRYPLYTPEWESRGAP